MVGHRSLPPELETRRGHIWRVFHLWLPSISFGGRLAHLATKVAVKRQPIINLFRFSGDVVDVRTRHHVTWRRKWGIRRRCDISVTTSSYINRQELQNMMSQYDSLKIKLFCILFCFAADKYWRVHPNIGFACKKL